MTEQPSVTPPDLPKNYDEELAQPPSELNAERVDPAALRHEAQERAKERAKKEPTTPDAGKD